MARARPARGAGIYSIAGPRWQEVRTLVDQHLPSPERFRQLVPVFLVCFVIVASLGFYYQISTEKESALTAARRQLALNADVASLKLSAEVLASSADWQGELARSLPLSAAREGRVALLSDAEGGIQARVPIGSDYQGNLLRVLGPGQPLTIMGADAGVMRVTLNDGTDALVTVRSVPRTDAQLTLIQPVGSALAGWRSSTTIEVVLLLCGGLMLALFAGAFWYLTPFGRTKDSDSLTRELTQALPGCGVWRWNLARGHVAWSPPMYALLGLEPSSEIVSYGMLANRLHREDDLRAEIDRHMREGIDLFDQCFRLRHAHGHWATIRLRGHITRDTATGEPYLTGMAVLADPNAVPGAADANARLRDAVETISEAFVLWDNHNKLVMCNTKYQQFHGLADDMVQPGSSYDEVIAAASEPIVSKRYAVANKNNRQSRTYEAQLEDGRWLRINERRTRDGGYVSVGTDITDLKQSQTKNAESEQQLRASVAELRLSRRELEHQKQQLVDLAEKYALEKNRAEAANRAKSEFLANISHELRTPLNAIIGFSEVMQESLFGPLGHEKYQEYARDIYSSGAYLLEVINDILDMSKIEAGRMTLDLGNVDVAEIVEDSMKVVSQTAAERGIALERHGPERFPIQADRRYLKQVFLNLLSNAVKFSREGGRVDVKLARSNGQLRIAIKDTGIGIAEAHITKLGRPFEQVENQFSKSHQGSGLGLAISRALVELHGGTLEIKSREGFGTTVTCSLPIRTPRPADIEEPLAQSA
jgi:two-component system cell cycle sensor histidine kinase PleC